MSVSFSGVQLDHVLQGLRTILHFCPHLCSQYLCIQTKEQRACSNFSWLLLLLVAALFGLGLKMKIKKE